MNKNKAYLNSTRVGDPSSKYGLNPNKFDEDMANNMKKYNLKKKRIYNILENEITGTPHHEDNYKIIISVLIELREKYNLMS